MNKIMTMIVLEPNSTIRQLTEKERPVNCIEVKAIDRPDRRNCVD